MKSLFPENELTRENIVGWAKEQVAQKPVVTSEILAWRSQDEQTTNTVELVLRAALGEHYLRNYCQYDKAELVEAVMIYVMDGISDPVSTMTQDELLDEILQICTPQEDETNTFALETMDDFVRVFVKGKW